MTKASSKPTKVQIKALKFIRTSLENSGTSPTLRELCAFMEYSAIGSAQDLVAALRKKSYLRTPVKQAARSLVLTPEAIALTDPVPPPEAPPKNHYVIPCFDYPPPDVEDVEAKARSEELRHLGTLLMSVSLFDQPYPDPSTMYAVRARDNSLDRAGIIKNDWLIVSRGSSARDGQIVVTKTGQKQYSICRHDAARPDAGADFGTTDEKMLRPVIGKVVAIQRVLT